MAKTIGEICVNVKINVKLSLWYAIKLRIAGIKHVINTDYVEKKATEKIKDDKCK